MGLNLMPLSLSGLRTQSFCVMLLLCFFSQMQAVQFGRLYWFAGVLYVPYLLWLWYAVHMSWHLMILNPGEL